MNPYAYQKLRIVGVEDGSFRRNSTETVLTAVLFHDLWIEAVQFRNITVDGDDATERLTEMLHKWRFDVTMLAGLSFAGFNVIDPHSIFLEFHKPVIVVCRKKPDNVAVKKALRQHFADWERRWKVFEEAAPVYSPCKELQAYVELIGLNVEFASKILSTVTLFGRVPEPIRVARIIARGVSQGLAEVDSSEL